MSPRSLFRRFFSFLLSVLLLFSLQSNLLQAEDQVEAKVDTAIDSYQTAKDTTAEALLTAYEKLKSKLANLVIISRADIVAANNDYQEIFLREEERDQDLRKIYEERYRLACKKVAAVVNKTESSLKKYEKARERLDKIRKEMEELEQAQMCAQDELRTELNEISSIYAIELEQARKAAELIRRRAIASHQPIKKIVEEEIRVLRKGLNP